MNYYRIEVEGIHNSPLFIKKKALFESVLHTVVESLVVRKYFLVSCENSIAEETLKEVFCDPVQDKYITELKEDIGYSHYVQVGFRPGVTDNTAHSAEEAFRLQGIDCHISTGDLYLLKCKSSVESLEKLAVEYLGNNLIQTVDVNSIDTKSFSHRFTDIKLPSVEMHGAGKVESFNLDDFDQESFEKMNKERCLAMTWDEFKHLKENFLTSKTVQDRARLGLTSEITDVELEVIAQSWSEHCKHKIFSADISIDENVEKREIKSLYKTFVKGATTRIENERKIPWLKSVFKDNAGIVRFDEKVDLCIKVETHNSPSALDPYGGALTGILGVNRDILGTGMGAMPVANTDVFCFADPKWPLKGHEEKMPDGLLKPMRLLEGVHKGIEDGGNKSGIPTVNGAIFFNESYAGKPLVYCGTVGVMPQKLNDGRDAFEKYVKTGDKIFVVGGAVGADGIHGATMSSLELDENSPSTAVQIGDPLTQRRVTDFLIEAREQCLYSGLTDNGAGGISSSIGEMATMTNGAEIELSNCPLKYPGLLPYEIMISESQERMSFAVPASKADAFSALAEQYNVSAVCLGEFNDSGYLKVTYKNNPVTLLDLEFLHESLPSMKLEAKWDGPVMYESWLGEETRSQFSDQLEHEEILKKLLASPNVASKESWVRQYDHEVKGATHIKPFTGKSQSGVNDSGVIWLKPHGGEDTNAISIACGMAQRISPWDPYLMAKYAVDEAMRNVVANGGDPDTCCMLDNFCWPDPVKSEGNPDGDIKLAQLVKTCEGLYDITVAYGAPLVSGKDSMKNDFKGKNKKGDPLRISILPTLLITAMAKADINCTVSSEFKNEGDHIYVVGPDKLSFSGSEFADIWKMTDISAPAPVDEKLNMTVFRKIHSAIKTGLLKSCHDVSDGGLMTAVAESCFGNDLGVELDMNTSLLNLYGEGTGRFIVSISSNEVEKFEEHMQGIPFERVGSVVFHPQFKLVNNGELLTSIKVSDLKSAWKSAFEGGL